MSEINSFKKSTKNGVTIYEYNGLEVSKEEWDAKRAASKKSMEAKLGMTIEEKRKKMKEKHAAAKAAAAAKFAENTNAKGGIVKKYKGGLMVKPRAAKRGY